MLFTVISIIVGYLSGSISSAIIICKLMNLPDPRKNGSKNPGATNVLRISGKVPAALTLFGDALKGFLPVILGHALGLDGFMLGLVALAALLGHIFPIFFGFKGGKGVATSFGAILGLSFPLAIGALVTWLIVAYLWKYSSLAALVTVVLAPIYAAIFIHPGYLFPLIGIAALVLWRHRANIKRLKAGTEEKFDMNKQIQK